MKITPGLQQPLAWLAGGLLIAAEAASGSAPPVLEGRWAGDQLQLTLGAKGGRVESGCASGTLVGPVKPGADGSFTALGTFDQHARSAQREVERASDTATARYVGELQGGVLKLSIWPAGAVAPQVFRLQEGAQIKLLRCL